MKDLGRSKSAQHNERKRQPHHGYGRGIFRSAVRGSGVGHLSLAVMVCWSENFSSFKTSFSGGSSAFHSISTLRLLLGNTGKPLRLAVALWPMASTDNTRPKFGPELATSTTTFF